jgi:hypothetical protein
MGRPERTDVQLERFSIYVRHALCTASQDEGAGSKTQRAESNQRFDRQIPGRVPGHITLTFVYL